LTPPLGEMVVLVYFPPSVAALPIPVCKRTARRTRRNRHKQVVTVLKSMLPLEDWRQGVTRDVGELHGEKKLEERLEEIKDIVERMDTRWDNGFFADDQDYLEQQRRLQQEMEQLTPVPDDELQRAADMLENFGDYWDKLKDDPNGRHELLNLIVKRVYMDEYAAVKITLKSNYNFVLGHNANGPTKYLVNPLYTFE